MAATQSADLFGKLYNARMGTVVGSGLMSPGTALQKREGAYTGALADYKDLTDGGGGTRAPTPTPNTFRTAIAMPTIPVSNGMGKGAGEGGKGGSIPGSTLPVYDTGKVEGLAQRFAAPGVRNLRNALQTASQGYYDNPNVKAQTLRETLAGYGSGLESVEAGALKTASGVYGQEYGAQVQGVLQDKSIASQESMQAAQIASNEKLAQYGNEFKAYLASLG